MISAASRFRLLFQKTQVRPPVPIGFKHARTQVTALRYVVEKARPHDPRYPTLAPVLYQRRQKGKNKVVFHCIFPYFPAYNGYLLPTLSRQESSSEGLRL